MSQAVAGDGALEIAPLSQSAGDPRPRHRHARLLRQVGAGEGRVRADGDAPRRRSPRSTPASPARRAVDAAIECIGCGVCYATCDVVGWNPDVSRPRRAQPGLDAGQRRARRRARRRASRPSPGDAGCHACHTHQSCTERCPKQLAPTASIAGLKRATALAALAGEIDDGAVAAAERAAAEALLWLAQRASAAVLALCVVVHLAHDDRRGARRAVRGRDPRAHPRQRRLDGVLRRVRARRWRSTRRSACARSLAECLGRRTAAASTSRWRRSRCCCWPRAARGRRGYRGLSDMRAAVTRRNDCARPQPRRLVGVRSSIASRGSRSRCSCRCISWSLGAGAARRGRARRHPRAGPSSRWSRRAKWGWCCCSPRT